MADDDRDPTSCSLIFLALGKKKVLHGLWRQAPGHKEQGLMMKFLGNDFELERWKTAAIKNAYALLSKQRFGACRTLTATIPGLTRRIRCSILYAGRMSERRHYRLPQTDERLATRLRVSSSRRRRY